MIKYFDNQSILLYYRIILVLKQGEFKKSTIFIKYIFKHLLHRYV